MGDSDSALQFPGIFWVETVKEFFVFLLSPGDTRLKKKSDESKTCELDQRCNVEGDGFVIGDN